MAPAALGAKHVEVRDANAEGYNGMTPKDIGCSTRSARRTASAGARGEP
jgi:hypothetical protein